MFQFEINFSCVLIQTLSQYGAQKQITAFCFRHWGQKQALHKQVFMYVLSNCFAFTGLKFTFNSDPVIFWVTVLWLLNKASLKQRKARYVRKGKILYVENLKLASCKKRYKPTKKSAFENVHHQTLVTLKLCLYLTPKQEKLCLLTYKHLITGGEQVAKCGHTFTGFYLNLFLQFLNCI